MYFLEQSKITLFSGNAERDSVDTWLEVDFPFTIEPAKQCLLPSKSQKFTVTFAPFNAFDYKACLKSDIGKFFNFDTSIINRYTTYMDSLYGWILSYR